MDAWSVRPVELILMLTMAWTVGCVAGFVLRGWLTRRDRSRRLRARDEVLRDVARRQAPEWPAGAAAGSAASESAWVGPVSHRPRETVPPPPTGGRRWDGTGPLVLIVDDRLELRAVNGAFLSGHGYRVIEAEDGEAGLDAARRERPDLILLDHSLPRRTGLEVVRELKADPVTAGIPVVFMTAHSYGAVGHSAMAAGCAAFLPKPCDPSRVMMEVARHVGVVGASN